MTDPSYHFEYSLMPLIERAVKALERYISLQEQEAYMRGMISSEMRKDIKEPEE